MISQNTLKCCFRVFHRRLKLLTAVQFPKCLFRLSLSTYKAAQFIGSIIFLQHKVPKAFIYAIVNYNESQNLDI